FQLSAKIAVVLCYRGCCLAFTISVLWRRPSWNTVAVDPIDQWLAIKSKIKEAEGMSTIKIGVSMLFCFALSFFLLGYPRNASAQVLYGSVSGTIVDQSGAAVPRAHVVITNRATGIQRETDADENGHYAITDLRPGDYDLKVTAS